MPPWTSLCRGLGLPLRVVRVPSGVQLSRGPSTLPLPGRKGRQVMLGHSYWFLWRLLADIYSLPRKLFSCGCPGNETLVFQITSWNQGTFTALCIFVFKNVNSSLRSSTITSVWAPLCSCSVRRPENTRQRKGDRWVETALQTCRPAHVLICFSLALFFLSIRKE